MAVATYAVNNQWLGIAPEVTPGTPVNPVVYIPMKNPEWVPKVTYINDDSIVGSPTMYRDVVLGTIYYEFTTKCFLFSDIAPYLFASILGPDTVTGTVAPYTHTVGLQNNNSGSQPATFTVTWSDGHQVQQIAGCQLNKLDISMKIDAAIEVTANWMGIANTNPSLSVGSYNTANHPDPSWDTIFLLGTAQSFAVEEFDVSIERNAKPLFGAGQQTPRQIFQGPVKVSGKYLCFYDSNDPMAPNLVPDSLVRSQLATAVTFTDEVSPNYTVKLQMSATQFENPTEPSDKEYLGSAADFEAVGNSTDATNGGISPCKAIITNAISTQA